MKKKVKIYIVDKDETSVAIIESYLAEIRHEYSLTTLSDLAEAENLTDDNALNLFIVDVSENTDKFVTAIDNFERRHKGCKFILTSQGLKTDYIIQFLRNSKKEFVEKPVMRTFFLSAVNEIIEKLTSEQDFSGQGKLVSVFSNKGGLGKTTIALNLASELAKRNSREKVVIVDLNMFLGDVTSFLDVSSLYDLKFVSDNIRENSDITEFSTQYNDSNLFVIADSPYREYASNIDRSKIVNLFNLLRKTFKYIVVDCSSAITETTKYVWDFSDMILLVTEANLPALQNCKKCLDLLESAGLDEKSQLVLNRYSLTDDCQIEDVENVLQKNVMSVLPNDWFNVTDSINKGIPLGECCPDEEIYSAIQELADHITEKLCR